MATWSILLLNLPKPPQNQAQTGRTRNIILKGCRLIVSPCFQPFFFLLSKPKHIQETQKVPLKGEFTAKSELHILPSVFSPT